MSRSVGRYRLTEWARQKEQGRRRRQARRTSGVAAP